MKQRTFYLSIIFLIIFTLITVLISRKIAYVRPAAKKTMLESSHLMKPQPQFRPEAQQEFPQQLESSPVSVPPGVTIIKPAEPPRIILEEEAKIKDTKETAVKLLSSKAAKTKGIAAPKSKNLTPGVTRINKQPPEATKKTMRERGIIMY